MKAAPLMRVRIQRSTYGKFKYCRTIYAFDMSRKSCTLARIQTTNMQYPAFFIYIIYSSLASHAESDRMQFLLKSTQKAAALYKTPNEWTQRRAFDAKFRSSLIRTDELNSREFNIEIRFCQMFCVCVR